MDKSPLVVDEIAAGAEFLQRLHETYKPVKAAFWLRESDNSERYLNVVLEGLLPEDRNQAYLEVLRVTREIPEDYISPFRVKILLPDDPLARAVQEHYGRYPGSLLNGSLGGVEFVDLYVYRPPHTRP